MATTVYSLAHKKYQLNVILTHLRRSLALVTAAESFYNSGLVNGNELRLLVTRLEEKLVIAKQFKIKALAETAVLETQFPFYINVVLVPRVYEDKPTAIAVNGSPDTITVTDHPDILSVFGVNLYGLLVIEDNLYSDHVIVDVLVHSTVGTLPDLNSELSIVAGTINHTFSDRDVVITLESIPS